ncbi:MAG: DMT family transporter [Ruminococcaceae bacterium]|nr:DMT family transporter [Oscillospiraceae bacterium]
MSKKTYLSGSLMLILTAFLWGTTFVAQSDAMTSIGPFTFSAIRSTIGAAALFILYLISGKSLRVPFNKENRALTLKGGLTCGVILFVSANLQNIGLVNAAPGKAAFITALYILIVPIIGLFLGKKMHFSVWICVAVSIVGFYMLNITPGEGFGLSIWEIMVLLCAVSYSFHIFACEKYGDCINVVLLSCMQFATTALLSFIFMFADYTVLSYPSLTLEMLGKTWFNLVYAGIFSSAIAYTLQIAGQKRVPAAAAVLLMSLESVFAVIAAWIFDPANALSTVQLIGCVLIFVSICVSQIPSSRSIEPAN